MPAGCEAVAKDIGGIAVAGDVGKEAEVKHLIAEAEANYGPVDVFFSNAGIGRGGHEDATDKDWADSWAIHVMAHVYAARALVPGMLARKSGYLLNTASAAGLLASMGSAPYGVTKHAGVALAEHLSIQYGDQGIAVSVLCPQAVDTNMLRMARRNRRRRSTACSNTDAVAQTVIEAMDEERFLILPHPEVKEYMARKLDRDRWLRGMRRLRDKTRRGAGAPHEQSVDLWLDLRSPYSFLAKDPAYALERELGVTLRLRPYTLDIVGAYNVADPKAAERGLRRMKYLYADVRRFANQRGMIIRGPKKIFDSTLVHLAWMFADDGGKGRALIDAAYPRFFKRELDYEDRAAVDALLKESAWILRASMPSRRAPGRPSPGARRRRRSRVCSRCRPSSSTANCSGARTASTSCAPSSAPSGTSQFKLFDERQSERPRPTLDQPDTWRFPLGPWELSGSNRPRLNFDMDQFAAGAAPHRWLVNVDGNRFRLTGNRRGQPIPIRASQTYLDPQPKP